MRAAKSVMSDVTLVDAKQTKKDKKSENTVTDASRLSPSAKDFADKAKKNGWATPTATRASFNG